MIVSCPLFVDLPRVRVKDKRIYLNLNVYRNLHPQLNNQAKVAFNKVMKKQILALPELPSLVIIRYVFYPGTKRIADTMNVCSIVDKFFCDALTHFKVIPDDDYRYVLGAGGIFGGIDRENPRVDAHIIKRNKPHY